MSNRLALRICVGIMVLSSELFKVPLISNNPTQWLFYAAVALVGFSATVFLLFLSA